MRVSKLSNNTDTKTVDMRDMQHLSDIITTGFGWSPGIFEPSHRSLANVKEAHVIALDFDKGMTLEEAYITFSNYAHIIGTSRSHQKEKPGKNGAIEPPCDRFRVVLKLTRPITSDDEYKATFSKLRGMFPACDPACSDMSRMFYPCTTIMAGDNNGATIDPVDPPKKEVKAARQLTAAEQGKLARSTLEFISIGKTIGGRHAALFKAAKDLQEQGFSAEDAEELLLRSPIVDEPGMPAADFTKAVKSAYRKEPKYPPRGSEAAQADKVSSETNTSTTILPLQSGTPATTSLRSLDLLDEALRHLANPEAVKGISTGWKEIDAMLGGLRQAELGIVQAYPKSGKTVFLTNLMANLTKQGHKVGFASLEMHPAKQVEPDLYSILLRKNIRAGVSEEDKAAIIALLTSGRGLTYFNRTKRPSPEDICEWAKGLYAEGVRFFFIDHFHKLVPDESSVSSIARTMTALTGLKYECPEMHAVLIVQPTKEHRGRDNLAERVGKNSLRGGAVIFDECDWLINLHTKYNSHRITETTWGPRRENIVAAYPNDIREIEFEAIRAKPYSENMGKKLYMKYDKGTTEMAPYKWIQPEPEVIEMPEQEDRGRGGSRRFYANDAPQSGWAANTWEKKRI